MQPELDESFAVDVLGERPRAELVPHRVSQGCASPRSAFAFLGTNDLRAARIEIEMERPSLVLTQRFVVELAQNVARDVTHDEAHDLVVDATLAVVQRIPNGFVERSRR